MPIEKISKNTTVSISLVVTIVGSLVAFVYQTAAIATKLDEHLHDPALHHNIVNMVRDNYVTRPELDSRFVGIKEDISEIKEILKDIAKALKD